MELLEVRCSAVEGDPSQTRLTAVILFADQSKFELWAEMPSVYADDAQKSGNAWLIAMLPMAVARGEDIKMELPVDALLLENLKGVIEVWISWFRKLANINIHAPPAPFQEQPKERIAAFYSGGIDSYFTVARRLASQEASFPLIGRLDTLISVWGFDVKCDDVAQFAPLAEMLTRGARQLNLDHVVIRTNLRVIEPTLPFKDIWRKLSHGAGLSFVAHLLRSEHREVVIGSSHTYGHLFPWGSDPMLDPLYSSSNLSISHDGAMYSRTSKTDIVGRFPPAAAALHVCLAQGVSNCSHCEKCYRTMMTLDIFGHRERMANAFAWDRYDVRNIRRFIVRTNADRLFRNEILDAATAHQRQDIVQAFRYATYRSRVIGPILEGAEWLMRWPGIWRLGVRLRKLVLRGPIRKI